MFVFGVRIYIFIGFYIKLFHIFMITNSNVYFVSNKAKIYLSLGPRS